MKSLSNFFGVGVGIASSARKNTIRGSAILRWAILLSIGLDIDSRDIPLSVFITETSQVGSSTVVAMLGSSVLFVTNLIHFCRCRPCLSFCLDIKAYRGPTTTLPAAPCVAVISKTVVGLFGVFTLHY